MIVKVVGTGMNINTLLNTKTVTYYGLYGTTVKVYNGLGTKYIYSTTCECTALFQIMVDECV